MNVSPYLRPRLRRAQSWNDLVNSRECVRPIIDYPRKFERVEVALRIDPEHEHSEIFSFSSLYLGSHVKRIRRPMCGLKRTINLELEHRRYAGRTVNGRSLCDEFSLCRDVKCVDHSDDKRSDPKNHRIVHLNHHVFHAPLAASPEHSLGDSQVIQHRQVGGRGIGPPCVLKRIEVAAVVEPDHDLPDTLTISTDDLGAIRDGAWRCLRGSCALSVHAKCQEREIAAHITDRRRLCQQCLPVRWRGVIDYRLDQRPHPSEVARHVAWLRLIRFHEDRTSNHRCSRWPEIYAAA